MYAIRSYYAEDWWKYVRHEADLPLSRREALLKILEAEHGWEIDWKKKKIISRITSYNVCYTKLLRLVLDTLEALGLKYVVCFASNPILKRWVKPLLRRVRRLAKRQGGSARQFFERSYQAVRWSTQRRLISKVEVIPYEGRDTKDNPRYVLTNLPRTYKPERIYDLYCGRGSYNFV